MIDSKLRKNIQPLFDVLGNVCIRLKLSPNTITIIAFIIGGVSALFILRGYTILALVFLWLSGLFDVLDGTVARLSGQTTKIGAYMDLIFDRMVEAMIILGFYIIYPENTLAYIIFFIAVLFNFTTFTVASTVFENSSKKSIHYDVGIAERTETFIVFSIMILFTESISTVLMIFNGIIFITGIVRFVKIVKYDKELRNL